MLTFYERAAAEHGISDMRDRGIIRDYLTRRPAALQRQLNTYLGAELR